jgi:hypothetical protein
MKFLLMIFPCALSFAQSVNWVQPNHTQGWPGANGFLQWRYDPASSQTILYGVVAGSVDIYSTDVFGYNSASNTFTHINGVGSLEDLCTLDTPTLPGERQFSGQIAVDTKRASMLLYGGANQSCTMLVNADGSQTINNSGQFTNFVVGVNWVGRSINIGASRTPSQNPTYTIVSVTDKHHAVVDRPISAANGLYAAFPPPDQSATGVHQKADTYSLALNVDNTLDSWVQLNAPHGPPPYFVGVAAYDQDDDIIFHFGYDGGPAKQNNWVYCSTIGNPTPGVLTAPQSGAGCVNPDDWSLVAIASCVGNCNAYKSPKGSTFPSMIYDTTDHKFILYGGNFGANNPVNETWAFDAPTKSWTQRCISPCSPPPVTKVSRAGPPIAYVPSLNKVLYHHLDGPSDYAYDYPGDTWTLLLSSGGGATYSSTPSGQALAYDPIANALIGWNEGTSATLWIGYLQ